VIPAPDLLLFAGAALLMVLTPGPNMIYLLSRSISQGRAAGVISLFGVIAGFFVHMFAAALGLMALFMALPVAYELLKVAGAVYLLYLAWQAVRPGARWLAAQRYLMGGVLGAFALRLALEERR
jgi:threonine/homoserine/homoserine lactone efflux protein